MIAELDALYDMGWRGGVFFVDDNFIGNKRKLKSETLPAIIEWREKKKRPFSFFTQASINLAGDEELMRLMTAAGFETVFVGIESPNEESLRECNKLPNKGPDLLVAVKKIQNHGLQVQGGFIVGFDSDPISIFKSQIEFIQKSGIVTAMVGVLMAPPETRLYKRLKKENRILRKGSGDNTDGSTNFIPKMGKEALASGYRHVVDTIYAPKQYYERIKTFLREYRPSGRGRLKISIVHLLALIRSASTVAALVPRDAANHATLESALEQARTVLAGHDIQIETQLLTGSPPEVLIEFADQHSPDLIVLGARGLRATLGILDGGTVQQIVEYATWPVLVVRAPYTGLRRILLSVDGSEYSQRALHYLGRFPLPPDAQVRLMHVLPPMPSPALVARSWPIGTEAVAPIPSYETEALLSKQAEEEEREGRALLERARKELQEDGLLADTVLFRGDAATEIIGYVKAHQIDLIVAGSRGLSPMKRLLLGSLPENWFSTQVVQC